MLDFEPYFSTLEDCEAPFEVQNSLRGLVSHIERHVRERHHVDMLNGGHRDFDEDGEQYATRQGNG